MIIILLLFVPVISQTTPLLTMGIETAQKAFNSRFCRCSHQEICQKSYANISSLIPHYSFSNKTILNNPDGIQTILVSTFLSSNIFYNFKTPIIAPTESIMYRPFETEQKGIKGIILYFHPSIFGRSNGPTSNSEEFQALGGLYSSQNYVFIAPNFLGFGDIEPELPHPYVTFPLQILNASIQVLNKIAGDIRSWYSQEYPLPLNTIGYSEGGAYSVWFNKCFSDPWSCPALGNQLDRLSRLFQLQKSAGLEGAYDLNVQFEFLTSDVRVSNWNMFRPENQWEVNVAKPGLTALTAISFLTFAAGKSSSELKNYFAIKFFDMVREVKAPFFFCTIDGIPYNIFQALNDQIKATQIEISTAIACGGMNKTIITKYPDDVYVGQDYEAILKGSRNSIELLVDLPKLNQLGFKQALDAATIVQHGKEAKSPLFIFTLAKDSVVTPLNAILFLEGRSDKVESTIFTNDDYQTCTPHLLQVTDEKTYPVDHLGGEILANIFALNFLKKV